MSKVKTIAYFGIGIALYFILSMTVKIPLIGHIQTDLGYIAYGVFLYLFGIPALIIGVIGCLLESLLISGWIPIGWMLGQTLIGIICGYTYKKFKSNWILILISVIAVFIGVGLIKTIVECVLYDIPFAIKFFKNGIAVIADSIPLILGCFLGKTFENRKIIK